MKIRIGHLSTFYHTSILMISRNTLLSEVEWKLFGTGPAIVDAFSRDEIDIAYIGLPPAIIGIDRGIAIKCIAGGHIEGTVICGDNRFEPASDMNSLLEQLDGSTLGVPGKGSIHDVIITDSIARLSYQSRISVRNFRWADMVLEAFHKREISAAVGTPALAVALMTYARGKILYPPSKLWPYNPSYGIVATCDFIKKNREAINEFLIRHEEATLLLRNHPHEAASIIADHIKIVDDEFVLNTIMVSPKYCAAITDEYINSTMKFVSTLVRLGYIHREIREDEIFDTSMISEVHPGKGHY